ncbi:MAG: hypothetical protein E6767_15105 [Dysgonomonas sp.]|nr:hypothetical protein [Dysgonomonas sp.]
MDLKLIVEHKHIFGSPTHSLDCLLKDIEKELLVRIASNLIKGFYDDIHFFCTSGKFFSTPNSDFAYHLLLLLRYMNSKRTITIFNTHSSLFFLEKVLSMPNANVDNRETQTEINLLKAYLTLNQELVEKENKLIEKIETLNAEEKLAAYLFYQPLAYSDFVNYDYGLEVMAQTVKAILFFKFCETHLSEHLRLFCEKYNKENWKEYLKSYMFIPYTMFLNKSKEISIISLKKEDADFNDNYSFLDKFCINNENVLNDKDFTKVRMYPLYKESDTNYIVLFDLFTAERIYRSLYFDFREINDKINETKEAKDRLTNFRQFITDNFSERSILYDLLDKIFSGDDFINLKGSDYLNAEPKIKGEPDYYVRKDNNIFLFESKDNLMNAEIKSSYDYDKITEDLDKKLNQKKGIKQICNNIDKILKKQLPIDSDYDKDNVNIYPILVLHERIYSNIGLNYILNKWFEDKVKSIKDSIPNPERIRPLVIIDIDTFILLQNVEQGDDFDFKKLLENYYNKTENITIGEDEIKDESKLRKAFISKYYSFKDFVEPIIKKKIAEKGAKTFFKDLGMELFK